MRRRNKRDTILRKWSSDMTEQFVKGYESLPCLWDPSNPTYSNKKIRDTAYRRLAAMMDIEGFDVQEVKSKIKGIRNTYSMELAKIRRSRDDEGEGYSRLAWFPAADNFLRNIIHVKSENVAPNETAIKNEPQSSNSRVPSPSPQQIQNAVKRKRESSLEEYQEEQNFSHSYQYTNNATHHPYEEYPRHHNYRPYHSKKNRFNDNNDNEYDIFGKSVACQLKKLPEMMAQESMVHIQTYFFKQRLKARKLRKKRQSERERFDRIDIEDVDMDDDENIFQSDE